jgi:hypothetical protein
MRAISCQFHISGTQQDRRLLLETMNSVIGNFLCVSCFQTAYLMTSYQLRNICSLEWQVASYKPFTSHGLMFAPAFS